MISLLDSDARLSCLVVYGGCTSPVSVPALFHLPEGQSAASGTSAKIYKYTSTSPYFVLPQAEDFDPGSAGVAHSRTLIFLRRILGGPLFDLEAIWEEHCYFEFQVRSVSKTMGTMVVSRLPFPSTLHVFS